MDLAALIVAVVAAVISVLGFGWTIGWSIWTHRKTTRPHVLVEGRFGVVASGVVPMRCFSIAAVNEGLVPVTCSGAFVEVEGASEFFAFFRFLLQSGGELPVVLGPGETWTGFVIADEMRGGVEEIARDLPAPWSVRVGVSGPGRKNYLSARFEMSLRPGI